MILLRILLGLIIVSLSVYSLIASKANLIGYLIIMLVALMIVTVIDRRRRQK
ncbi:hypothetical protein SAMN05216244_3906 [Sediminibacillus halophilus]|uniref:Uncharacterized protein n=1 Tax=Sediminibacillus halophilus TaxID=482461 RepID=A0A1G9XP51_9BACI|nr:hypothetical protein SAMN05216244_3906 [Sediminibacillus halophilus]